MKLNKPQGNKAFRNLLKAELTDIGFKQKGGVLTRQKKNGFEQIDFEEIDFWNGQFRLWYSASKRIEPVEGVWDDYFLDIFPLGVGEEYVTRTIYFNASILREYQYDPMNMIKWRRMNDYHFADPTEEGIHELVGKFLETIKSYIIPTFDKYNNIQLLDAFINERPEYFFEVMHLFPDRGFEYKKMIIAKLAGNKDYELVCEAVRKDITTTEYVQGDLPMEKYLSLYEKIYERLKTVAPLANPILD
ncbi:hypothetical protein [Niastella populi]|uniref:DUF4304 domain-containing protein n=1 Tax=Niastella populi TaxID=550983 RepID=A0A1V9FGI5_9BACT|nr:hypothetical protein [Niastella populi]OQP57473.1 hypothetical protein A4R26_24180 [Niastella populi]